MSRPEGSSADEPRPAGPVVGQVPSSSQAAGEEDPNPTPPAGDAGTERPAGSRAGDPPAGEADQAKQVETDLDALLADTQRERDEYLDLAKRTKADFENFRKRMTAEVQAAGTRGKAALVGELVHVVDNLERALETVKGADGKSRSDDPLAQGIGLTYRDLCMALQNHGVEMVDPVGERFDPTWHEALTTKPAAGSEAGIVIETMQKGYRMGDQLIRPARVVVSE